MKRTAPPRGAAALPPAIMDALRRAVSAQNAGHLDDAEALYNLVLSHDRRQFDALNMLGIVRAQRGDYAAASRLIERAVKVNPRSAEAFVNLGRVQFAMGEPRRAEASYAQAIALRPDFSLAHSNFAAVLRRLGRPQDALRHCDTALALQPNQVEAVNNRGGALFDLGRHEEALASFDRALAMAPELVEAWLGRANAAAALGRLDEAIASYGRALALNPGLPDAWIGCGDVLSRLGRHDEALAAYDKAIAADPKSARAWQARGLLAESQRRFGDAFAAYETAMSIDPTLDFLEGRRLHAKMHLCDWTNFGADCAHLLAAVNRGVAAATPFTLIGILSSGAEQLKCARRYVASRALPSRLPPFADRNHDRITLAYLSGDFRDHAVSHLLAGLFEKHDRARFHTIAISLGADPPSPMRARLRGAFETFIDAGRAGPRQVAELVRANEVDIAVDLMGFTHDFGAGILAARPAPVQVSFLGYAGTIGADFIDYLIADRIVIPPDQQGHYAEKVVYLPDSFQPNDDRRTRAPQTSSRAAAGLPPDGIVFCCFNQTFKITPQMFDIWMRILRATDGSVAWIQDSDPAAARNLRAEAERRGIAAERIVIAPRTATYEEHLARLPLADLFLDTFPYNAHTTASDALWMGVPVVTCLGATFASRVAASLLNAVGLPELVAPSFADYEALALRLAREPATLAAIKTKLAHARTTCPLFDTDRFRRHIEAAYATMFQRYVRGEPPQSFAVPALETP